MKAKILHVTQSTGGLETILLLLLRHYDRHRFTFHLACPPGTALEASARALGVPVFGIRMVRAAHPFRDALGLAQLTSLIRRERYAIVHGHSAKGGYLARVAARLAGEARTVYAPQAFSYLSQQGLARSFFLGLERLAVRFTDMLVAASESERCRAVREVGYPERRVVVIPNSIDFDEVSELPRETSGGAPVVLTIARLTYQKNPEMFVRVAALVAKRRPDARFVMMGAGFGGPLESQVRRLVSNTALDDRLQIVPWGSKREALRTLSESAVFVLTSRFEGMPNTLLEALMLAKPTVATDVDGIRDILERPEIGFLVAENDDEAMAERIVTLLGDRKTARNIGLAGKAHAHELFDVRKNVTALTAVYERLLS